MMHYICEAEVLTVSLTVIFTQSAGGPTSITSAIDLLSQNHIINHTRNKMKEHCYWLILAFSGCHKILSVHLISSGDSYNYHPENTLLAIQKWIEDSVCT